jgi:hypothetical protein
MSDCRTGLDVPNGATFGLTRKSDSRGMTELDRDVSLACPELRG